MKEITAYLKGIEKYLKKGDATEHTYRHILQKLLEELNGKITVTNEPKRYKCGAPDYNITKGAIPVGHIEAKDIGKSLDAIEKDARLKKPKTHDGQQLKRYTESLGNLILTDYLEFRWFEHGEKRLAARLAEVGKDNKLKKTKDGIEEFTTLWQHFLDYD
ncbi:MAG: DNA methyltransferase, partial [candidate division Zixibacteria bacterium]|nr:DNA methyltransferase [candidate division Zixibacteria bacterium]